MGLINILLNTDSLLTLIKTQNNEVDKLKTNFNDQLD